MPNNLAYYVTGDQHAAKELKLVLNVNDRDNAEDGHRALAIASGFLTKAALGTYLMEEVYKALVAGRADRWKAGKNKIEIVRDDWETGKGYEVKFIIR